MKHLFIQEGFYCNGLLNFTPREAYREAMENNAILVDVREEYLSDYKKFTVPQTLFLPFSLLAEHIAELPTDVPLIIADSVGLRSKDAVILLKDMGFDNVANLAGGLVEWERDGLPLHVNNDEMLTGSCTCQLKKWNKKK